MADGKSFVITTDPKDSPVTVAHILDLVRRHFYAKQRVHRVEDWVTQWGDPLSKTSPMSDKKMVMVALAMTLSSRCLKWIGTGPWLV